VRFPRGLLMLVLLQAIIVVPILVVIWINPNNALGLVIFVVLFAGGSFLLGNWRTRGRRP
jgi:hypothetical protein